MPVTQVMIYDWSLVIVYVTVLPYSA